MQLHFHHIGIWLKPTLLDAESIALQLITFFQAQSIPFCFEQLGAAHLSACMPYLIDREAMGACDLLIAVGGDGTLLHAARAIVFDEIPIVGINQGRLGFLTDICPGSMLQDLQNILSGDYTEEARFLLKAQIWRAGVALPDPGIALNEVVLYSGDIARMVEFDIWVNAEFVCRQRSDGLITATPTGSTAYALSGGGPILHPGLQAITLVPMHAHTLSIRPIVLDASAEIRLHVPPQADHCPRLSCDGHVHFYTQPNDWIQITRLEVPLRLIHPKDHAYFRVLRSKLGWGSDRAC